MAEPKEETLSDIFDEKFYINESVIQEQVSKGEGIEFSYTGDLIPVEIVEVAIMDFVKKLKEHNSYPNGLPTIIMKRNDLDKYLGDKFK